MSHLARLARGQQRLTRDQQLRHKRAPPAELCILAPVAGRHDLGQPAEQRADVHLRGGRAWRPGERGGERGSRCAPGVGVGSEAAREKRTPNRPGISHEMRVNGRRQKWST